MSIGVRMISALVLPMTLAWAEDGQREDGTTGSGDKTAASRCRRRCERMHLLCRLQSRPAYSLHAEPAPEGTWDENVRDQTRLAGGRGWLVR